MIKQSNMNSQKDNSLEYHFFPNNVRKPHICPICHGKGIVPNGFYSNTKEIWTKEDIIPEKCRSCMGTGILWG